MTKLAMIAFGGNALLRAGQKGAFREAPKVRAGIFFIENGGKQCIITEAGELSNPSCGPRIVK